MGRLSCFHAILFLSFLTVSVQAASYLPDVPGTVMRFSGETRFNDELRPASLIITVMSSEIDSKTGNPLVVHEHILSILGKRRVIRKFYEVKDDGIYLVGEAEAPNNELLRYDKPLLYLPVPPRTDYSWNVDIGDANRQIHLKCTVVGCGEGVEISDQKLRTVHLRLEGTSSAMFTVVPIKRETWFEQDKGVVKIVMEQTLKSTLAVTELYLLLNGPVL